MAEIVKAGNPVLKMVAKPVTVFDKKLKLLIAEMKKDMYLADVEGCLSVPGWFGEVERYAHVIVKYQDIHGKKKQKKVSGLMARCVQHEVDHINGILYIERAISLHKDPRYNET